MCRVEYAPTGQIDKRTDTRPLRTLSAKRGQHNEKTRVCFLASLYARHWLACSDVPAVQFDRLHIDVFGRQLSAAS